MPLTYQTPVLPRSAGSIAGRRERQPWPKSKDFRILSIDGGGIRGLFPAGVLADFEESLGGGHSISEYFHLAAGTSTGGIIALGLGAGKSAREIRDLYMRRGGEIFPPVWDNIFGRNWLTLRNNLFNLVTYRYSRFALERVLIEFFGETILGQSTLRQIIPSFDGRFSEVFVFKTRHHQDYKQDWRRTMVDVALATSAAPTIYKSCDTGGYRLIDGGIWANNPIMLAVVEALTTYDVPLERIKVLSLGCGCEPFYVTRRMASGGFWHWRKAIGAAMHAQALAATNQARLLLGPENVVRIDPIIMGSPVELDDYRRAMDTLLPAVAPAAAGNRERVRNLFLQNKVDSFSPLA